MSTTTDELTALFSKIGLADKKSAEIVKNKKVAHSLFDILQNETDLGAAPYDDKKLALLHSLAVESKGTDVPNRKLVTEAILDGRLKTNLQVSEGLKFVKLLESVPSLEAFNEASGVGIELSEQDVKKEIAAFIEVNKTEIESKRYTMVPKVLGESKKLASLKWAPPNLFKPIIDDLFLAILGPKDERDTTKQPKKKEAAVKKTDKQADTATAPVVERSMFSEGFLGALHKAGDQPQMYPELIKGHLAVTKGKVYTRFPPEPNGFLHIGHSKAIMVNFGYAKYHDGVCYLRFDDTNPEAEEEVYFNSIKDMVSWLGFEPWKITYSSDYFDELYELAEKLIEVGGAYVCHCTSEQVKQNRGMKEDGTLGGERKACAERDTPVEENLRKFRAMKDGHYKVGEATLRMKQDLTSDSPQMWDLVAYRVLNASHHRTGDKWKVYPTYDFTHCLVDSFENISHSLCTTEFRLSRESYEWLCDVLHVYRPAQREYGRLNITGTVLSKRKIAKLVNDNYVRGWNDPRLYTLEAIKRRGVPPGAILSFINTLGVTTSTTNIQVARFESAVRTYLDQTTPRLMMVLDPIEVVIDNLDDSFVEQIDIPYKPGNGGEVFGTRSVPFANRVYIDRNDFREEISKDYFRLAPGQAVGLMRVPFNISFKSVEKDAEGKITKIHAHYDQDQKKKPKTYIQWVPVNGAVKVKQVRIYNQLFKSENPLANPDGYLKDINSNSEEIIENAVIEPSFFETEKNSPLNIAIEGSEFNIKEKKGPETVRFQALREGYFCVDIDSSDKTGLILNRIVTLKEDANK